MDTKNLKTTIIRSDFTNKTFELFIAKLPMLYVSQISSVCIFFCRSNTSSLNEKQRYTISWMALMIFVFVNLYKVNNVKHLTQCLGSQYIDLLAFCFVIFCYDYLKLNDIFFLTYGKLLFNKSLPMNNKSWD